MRLIEPPSIHDVEAARERIAASVKTTPLVRLDVDAPSEIYLKLEPLQPIGSFKLRGALNAMRALPPEALADGVYTVGFQPHHLSVAPQTAAAVPLRAKVSVTEITGSESFIHLDFADVRWVMLAAGVHSFQPDDTIDVFIDPRHLMVFDGNGRAVDGGERRAA